VDSAWTIRGLGALVAAGLWRLSPDRRHVLRLPLRPTCKSVRAHGVAPAQSLFQRWRDAASSWLQFWLQSWATACGHRQPVRRLTSDCSVRDEWRSGRHRPRKRVRCKPLNGRVPPPQPERRSSKCLLEGGTRRSTVHHQPRQQEPSTRQDHQRICVGSDRTRGLLLILRRPDLVLSGAARARDPWSR